MNTGLLWSNLVTYSFQIGLLVGLAGFVPALLRLRWPGAKLIFWQILLAACLLLPLVRPWRQEVIAAVGVPVSTTIAIAASAGPAMRATMPRSAMALLLLAAGTLIRLGWLGVGFWRLRRYRLHARLLGLHGGCPTFLSDEIASPVTFGWRNPVVLVPARFPELEERLQDAILCHELVHVERRDWLFTIAEEVVRAVFWFHPAIWWLLGEIQLAREQAVDSQVIERTSARDEYVDALLTIAGAEPQMGLSPATLFLRKRHLKQRVMSIFMEVRMPKTRLISRLTMGFAILAAAGWIVTGTFPLAAAPQTANDAAGVSVDTGAAALLHRSPVSYPESARKKGVQGTVIVEATLDGSGNVSDAHVVSGPDELRRPALQSVLQWHFKGAAAGATRMVSIAFQLPETQNHSPAEVAGPVSATLRNTYGGNGTSLQVNTEQAQRKYQELVRLQAQQTPRQIDPELQAKLAEARAHPQNAEQYVAQLRSDPATHTLKSIVVLGLSDQVRGQLLAKLPVHEGEILTNDSLAKVGSPIREFDEHLIVTIGFVGSEATLTITAPGISPVSIASGNAAAKLIRQPRPVYPQAAKEARISGVVKLSAIIAADGTVKKLEVISGHPLLVPAALDAVKLWVYQPTLLNGNPVEVSTEISVSFTLSE